VNISTYYVLERDEAMCAQKAHFRKKEIESRITEERDYKLVTHFCPLNPVSTEVKFPSLKVEIVQDTSRDARGSTWNNFWRKIRVLAPFLWPRKDIVLQLRVILCFLLLIGGRVINLYVPLYSKKIG